MKNILSTFICFASLLSTGLMAETPVEYAKNKIANIDLMLSTYEMEGSEHKVDFNFHVGYITGQRRAYLDMIEALSLSRD